MINSQDHYPIVSISQILAAGCSGNSVSSRKPAFPFRKLGASFRSEARTIRSTSILSRFICTFIRLSSGIQAFSQTKVPGCISKSKAARCSDHFRTPSISCSGFFVFSPLLPRISRSAKAVVRGWGKAGGKWDFPSRPFGFIRPLNGS